MIPLTDAGWQSQPWQALLSSAITDINELVSLLDIDVPLVSNNFPLFVPLPYLSRIEHGNPLDPLLLQVLPGLAEQVPTPGFTDDALDEMNQAPVPGLLHKYRGRVLVITSGACAVNCRYCFRRHFPYGSFQPDTRDWDSIFDYINQDATISEVILSGGDPLVQSDVRLAGICRRIEAIPHVRTLRSHPPARL
jgi:KamA family protein